MSRRISVLGLVWTIPAQSYLVLPWNVSWTIPNHSEETAGWVVSNIRAGDLLEFSRIFLRFFQYTSTVPANNTCFGNVCGPDGKNYTTVPILNCTLANRCGNSTCDVSLGRCTDPVYKVCNDDDMCTNDKCVPETGLCQFDKIDISKGNNTCTVASCDRVYGVTWSNITCKGMDCFQDPTLVNFLGIFHHI